MYVCMCVCMYSMYVCMCVSMQTHRGVYVCVYVPMFVCLSYDQVAPYRLGGGYFSVWPGDSFRVNKGSPGDHDLSISRTSS